MMKLFFISIVIFFLLFLSLFSFSKNSIKTLHLLQIKEMKDIWAGVTCGGVRCIDWNFCSAQPCTDSPCYTCTANLKQRACVQSTPEPWICEFYVIEGECGEIVKNGTCIQGVCSSAGGTYTGIPCNRDYCSEYLQQ